MEAKKQAGLRLGRNVIIGLAILTALEFWAAAAASGPIPYPVLFAPLAPITWLSVWISSNSIPFLAAMAFVKAGLILYYFMHVSQLWSREH
ncbi:MAG: cytochrome C oxidase subunit IV family protein [Anaerolineae bacterium]